MKILVGETRDRSMVAEMSRYGWGRMWTVRTPKPYDGEPWGFDNGAFSAWLHGKPFPDEVFRLRVDRASVVGIPYLAVAPDLVGAGVQSLEFSLGWLDTLPAEWPWYLAVQDGMRVEDVDSVMPRFAGLFLGGTTRFKSTALTWRRVTARHGKPFHYGRAGVPSRIEHAVMVGADSLDSSFPLWTRARWAEFVQLVRSPRQSQLANVTDVLAGRCFDGDPLTGATP